MTLGEILDKIDTLQEKINSFGKLGNDVLNKINYKFRLDWNYNSNAMEGNSLTRQETRSVMINNITVEGKPLKDVIEIRGHDAVILDILKIGKGEISLSEKRIKDIHKAIIHEETPENQAKIGQWKTTNNHLINYKGEKFDFVDHAEVPRDMHRLIDWLSLERDRIKRKDNHSLHPAILAFMFHLKYVSIHPFYDGNGRTARIFMNLILISYGFPPVIVKIEDKEAYSRYLADIQAYGGDPNLFYEFMGKQLIKSQEVVLKAINGESIEEPNDIDKGIDLLKRSLVVSSSETEKSVEILYSLWENSLEYFVNELIALYKKFENLFENPSYTIMFQVGNQWKPPIKSHAEMESFFKSKESANLTSIQLNFALSHMKKYGYDTGLRVDINFTAVSYTITNYRHIKILKNYSEPLKKEESDKFIADTGKLLLEELNKASTNP